MKTLLRSLPVVVVSIAALGFAMVPAPAAFTTPRALIVAGYGDDGTAAETVSAAMLARNWTVQSVHGSGLAVEAPALNANWDVVWVLPGMDQRELWQISNGVLSDFAQNGGIVVLLGADAPETRGLDLLPGGHDVIPEAAPGATCICAPTHPLIAAAAQGGCDLTANQLDPGGTGGDCCLEPNVVYQDVAENAAGPVLATYDLGAGHVVVSVFDMLDNACLGNLLIYTESVFFGL